MSYLGTKPANQITDSTLIADGTVTPADLSTGKPVWDTSGNVGIGRTPASGVRLDVESSDDVYAYFRKTGGANVVLYGGSNQSWVYTQTNHPLILGTNNSERMRIDSSGNVGIGTSSPDAKLRVNGGANSLQARFSGADNRGLAISTFVSVGTNDNGVTYNAGVASDAQQVWQCGGTERMRIDSSGNLLVNTTTANARLTVHAVSGAAPSYFRVFTNGDAGTFYANASGTIVGQVQVNSSSTAYVTSSDYRLKENIAPMTGALAKVSALKPVTYNWKVDGSAGQGFIAHELAEVVPDCVTGEKDAVDAEGKPVYQGIDTSFLVATLTAAIQELKAELDTVKTELATLKGAV